MKTKKVQNRALWSFWTASYTPVLRGLKEEGITVICVLYFLVVGHRAISCS